jgi:hypothetical protein
MLAFNRALLLALLSCVFTVDRYLLEDSTVLLRNAAGGRCRFS